MLKLLKYEIKGTYKYISGILALVLILITGLYMYGDQAATGSLGGGLFVGLSVMILFGTTLVTFFYIVGSFRKELYEDRGYLTFTLPLKGIEIVGAKLIVALLWFFLLGIVVALYNLVMMLSFTPFQLQLSDLIEGITTFISIREIILGIIITIFSGVNLLTLIYFSMALGKVTFRNKRIGGLWFVIFLVLSGILAFGQFKIETLLPFYLDFETFKVMTMDLMNPELYVEYGSNGVEARISGGVPLNIAGTIYNIAITVALFFGAGYLIEKKIDL